MPQLLYECNIGINVDLLCPETEYGARNRINEFLRFNLPVISTRGAEITYVLQEHNAGTICESENTDALFRAIEHIITDTQAVQAQQKNAEKLKNTRFSATITQSPLREWIEHPRRAPDSSASPLSRGIMGMVHAGVAYYKQRGFRAFMKKLFQFIR